MFNKPIILVANEDTVLDKVIVEMSSRQTIVGILSQKLNGKYKGIPVFDMDKMETMLNEGKLLVIADNINMHNFTKLFLGKGLKLFKDYVPYWLGWDCVIDPLILFEYVGKDKRRLEEALLNLKEYGKILAIYGNCQTHALTYYISKVRKIQESYFILSIPQIWNLGHKQKFVELFSSGILYFVDVLFSQSISVNNRFGEMFSTVAVEKMLNPHCKMIKICNVFSEVYYPQFEKPKDYETLLNRVNISEEGLSIFKNMIDWNVCRLVGEGKGIEEILEIISAEQFYDKIYLNKRFWEEMENYERKEEELEIKIADYIEQEISKQYLFEANNHPTEVVFLEILRRMLSVLGIENENIYFDDAAHSPGLPGDEKTIVYPSTLQGMGLEPKHANIIYKLPTGKKVTFYEYMKTYIKIVFPDVNIEG